MTFLILYNVFGYFIVFKSVQYSIQSEIRRNIENSIPDCDLTIVKIDNQANNLCNKEFVKVNKSEFRFFGKLYDIVKIKVKSDTTYYYGINDTKEEQLFSALDSHVKRNIDQNSPVKDKASNLLKNIVKQVILNEKVLLSINESICKYSIANSKEPVQIFYCIPTPPPKNII